MCSISKDEPQTSHSFIEKLKKKHRSCQFCALGYNLCDNCDFSADQTADFWAWSCLTSLLLSSFSEVLHLQKRVRHLRPVPGHRCGDSGAFLWTRLQFSGEILHVMWLLFPSFVRQQAANIVRALELFVKPDVLSGENAYMCAKWAAAFFSWQESCIYINSCCKSFKVKRGFPCLSGAKRKCRQPNASQSTGPLMSWRSRWRGSLTSVEAK